MAEKQVHQCTGHFIKLCPDNKYLVNVKKAEMAKTMSSVNCSQVINEIIEEWETLKAKK
jgi:hypothetical protein